MTATKTKFEPGDLTSPLIQFREAFLKAQMKFKAAQKSAKNPYFHSNYATLTDIWEASKEALHSNGFVIHQTFKVLDTQTAMVTELAHISGWSETSTCLLPVNDDPQKMGSAITYFRRYSLASILGITVEDDDANSASGHPEPQKQQSRPISNPTKPETQSTSEYHMGIPRNRDFGKTLEEMGEDTVRSGIQYWSARVKSEGKEATGEVKKFLDAADYWLKAKSYANKHVDAPPPISDEDIPF